MTPKSNLYLLPFFLLLSAAISVEEDDIRCLQGIRSSLRDPQHRLSSWTFPNRNPFPGSLCSFIGVSCWNPIENRLVALQLKSMDLGGEVPASLQFCGSLQNLDLSDNSLSGSVPTQICTWLPYLVTLDLSGNNLSGPIPTQLVNCQYLNTLNLSDNRLSGSIPYQLSPLARLKQLSVANNGLSGEIPSTFSGFNAVGFEGNRGLCGPPLSRCGGSKKSQNNRALFVVVGVVAGVVCVFSFLFFSFLFNRKKIDSMFK